MLPCGAEFTFTTALDGAIQQLVFPGHCMLSRIAVIDSDFEADNAANGRIRPAGRPWAAERRVHLASGGCVGAFLTRTAPRAPLPTAGG